MEENKGDRVECGSAESPLAIVGSHPTWDFSSSIKKQQLIINWSWRSEEWCGMRSTRLHIRGSRQNLTGSWKLTSAEFIILAELFAASWKAAKEVEDSYSHREGSIRISLREKKLRNYYWRKWDGFIRAVMVSCGWILDIYLLYCTHCSLQDKTLRETHWKQNHGTGVNVGLILDSDFR